jgi:uncharacterized integral membrane protein (TIGR00697 family)
MMNRNAFQTVMGLNSLVMSASLIAYVVGQIIDIQLYAWIKQMTGPDLLWLRNNGSTLVSQMVDTIIVNLIHLYWGLGIELSIVLKMMLFSYVYKAIFSIINTPIFYGCVFLAKHRVPNKMLIN